MYPVLDIWTEIKQAEYHGDGFQRNIASVQWDK